MTDGLGILGASAGGLALLVPLALGIVGYLWWLRRRRGYLLLAPPGRHSASASQAAQTPRIQGNLGPNPELRDAAASSFERRLAAPVEIWFGPTCVGVSPGSIMHRRFGDYADELLADLDRAHDSEACAASNV